MGAEVIKIESPRAWDNVRTLLPHPGRPSRGTRRFYFNDYNRDKKSLTLDLAQPRGRELFLELVAKCDAVIENYRADVLDKLGLGYEVLREARPTSSSSAWPASARPGPTATLVGFGPIIEQMARPRLDSPATATTAFPTRRASRTAIPSAASPPRARSCSR